MSQSTPRQAPLALTFPLRGSQLIEASAGTGKTFTISALYLRLILGHGGAEAGFGRELLPPQILVVTFTEAATQELRDRIRLRLTEAARYFRDEVASPDALLGQLRDEYPREQWPACASRLDMAAQWMDEAAVSTIHGWCQRMLREHAFDSGSLFTQTLETDHSELLGEVLRDYWRRFCYGMQGGSLEWVRSHWGGPAALLPKVRALFGSSRGTATAGLAPAELIEAALRQRQQALGELKQPWADWAGELRQLFHEGLAAKAVDGRKIQARYFEPWFEKLAAWASDDSVEHLDIGTGFTRLTPDGVAEAWKHQAPSHPALHAMVDLPASLAALPTPHADVLEHAAQWVGQRFEQEKRRRAEMGFDDMLLRLDAALQGSGGERLASLIREQFPVALIDEFQDTDPVQYRIFASIYPIEENHSDSGLFLIGDPKQAIYAFRGADIYTYLRARRATEGRLHTLGTNFRSSHAMVEAVNHLFARAEQRPEGLGAFLFRHGADNPVPFLPVLAQGRKEHLQVDGSEVPALNFWQLASDEPVSGPGYRAAMAAACAGEIVRLLNAGQQGRGGFVQGEQLRGILPADIAILVRDGREAQAVRAELAARGVRSVYLSDKDSVFAAQEARDLLSWLKACAEPDAERPLRAALASITLDLPLAELERLNQDELAWEQRVMQFRNYRHIWRVQGVLPMLRKLLHDFNLPLTLIGRSDGERVLTNLLHLCELLQQASGELDGEQALIRHLSEHLALSGQTGEEQILRLESDEQLVKVITIHKSKGLEYPLVFLPFICSAKPVDGKRLPLAWHDEHDQVQVTLSPSAEQIELADNERLAEDLRLLYVALTRARHALWLGVADLKRGTAKDSILHRSAMGYLLGGGAVLRESAQLAGWLADAGAGCPGIHCAALPEQDGQTFVPPRNEAALRKPRVPKRKAAENWWIASYSALRISEGNPAAPDDPQAQKLFDDERLDPLAARQVPATSGDIHRFPRGPGPGTFLHGLLEWAGNEGFAEAAGNPQALQDAVARRCNRRGWSGWIPTLAEWLQHLLAAPLQLDPQTAPLRLGELSEYRIEMEFWFASHRVDVARLDALVTAGTHLGQPRAPAEGALLNGMFKGFIDLCFEHDGRYYVADYKSNWLGPDDQAYTVSAMNDAILHNRYDLQYVLYLLALHRQLKARLGAAYDYDRHVGGALFVFLRGIDSASQGLYFTRPPRELIEQLDALFSAKAPAAPGVQGALF
ncbi:exodeoxyribonuclease V subunit beta [Pseudomonas sp. HR96]|uniref:exodeoxyribonuclease V subunit beta n=1 Tax=Pseudomonas sp. HR96 TaxID=1027966 RepID=UPI002A76086E|nr:exodeoxyribonuclease V subunit beta [Pseudomonas sp. HR96]WPP00536.1 exodeoxyribonuclease V subunit beta [Pseudomonas sp. HR96]